MWALVAFVRLLSKGYETYEVACAHCHGDERIRAAGRVRVVFNARYFATHDTLTVRARVSHMVSEGRSAMTHVRGVLTEARVRATVAYLRSLPSS